MAASNSSNGNVNLRLNFLTIDDVIRRAALNSGVSPEQVQQDFGNLKGQYGRVVFGNKVVLVRPDLNVPFKTVNDTYIITDTERIQASVPTIEELSGYGARVVIMAHQGRPAEGDCISFLPHKMVLEELLKRPVIFREAHWYGEATQNMIKKEMGEGDILLLDNIRKLSDDALLAKDSLEGRIDSKKFASLPDSFPKVLGSLIDFFINDAFSVAHRWQGSVVGFPYNLNVAGRLMEREIIANRALSADTPHPYTMLLGGIKVTDYLSLVRESLDGSSVDYILAAGALGIMGVLGAMGRRNKNYLGKKTVQFLEERGIYGQLDTIIGIARRYPDAFILPLDFRAELDGQVYVMTPQEINKHPDKDKMNLYGIGPQTVAKFMEILKDSKTVYIKGSPTKDDDARFLPESRELIDAIVQLTRDGVMTILSGGDTTALVTRIGYSPESDFKTRTLAGGAATQFRVGELLAGLYMLHVSYNSFNGLPLTNGLGSHNVGFDPVAPRIPELLRPR